MLEFLRVSLTQHHIVYRLTHSPRSSSFSHCDGLGRLTNRTAHTPNILFIMHRVQKQTHTHTPVFWPAHSPFVSCYTSVIVFYCDTVRLQLTVSAKRAPLKILYLRNSSDYSLTFCLPFLLLPLISL